MKASLKSKKNLPLLIMQKDGWVNVYYVILPEKREDFERVGKEITVWLNTLSSLHFAFAIRKGYEPNELNKEANEQLVFFPANSKDERINLMPEELADNRQLIANIEKEFCKQFNFGKYSGLMFPSFGLNEKKEPIFEYSGTFLRFQFPVKERLILSRTNPALEEKAFGESIMPLIKSTINGEEKIISGKLSFIDKLFLNKNAKRNPNETEKKYLQEWVDKVKKILKEVD